MLVKKQVLGTWRYTLGFEVDLGSHGMVLSNTQRSRRVAVAGAIFAGNSAFIMGGACHISDAKTKEWGGARC